MQVESLNAWDFIKLKGGLMPIQSSFTAHGATAQNGYSVIKRVQFDFAADGSLSGTILVYRYFDINSFTNTPTDPLTTFTKTVKIIGASRTQFLAYFENQLLNAPEFSGGLII